MTMEIRQKEIFLEGLDTTIVVQEADWNYLFRYNEIEKELESIIKDPAQSEPFKFFCRNYYSLMASCVVGKVPTPEEAFSIPRSSLDMWYLAVWELNEDLMGVYEVENIGVTEEVIFRDDSSLTVHKSNGLPSFVIKLFELEQKAISEPIEGDPQGQMFLSFFYPKMAASCNGSESVPSGSEVRRWPRSEIEKWLNASRRVNPEWFVISEEEKLEATNKKEKKARKRSGG